MGKRNRRAPARRRPKRYLARTEYRIDRFGAVQGRPVDDALARAMKASGQHLPRMPVTVPPGEWQITRTIRLTKGRIIKPASNPWVAYDYRFVDRVTRVMLKAIKEDSRAEEKTSET